MDGFALSSDDDQRRGDLGSIQCSPPIVVMLVLTPAIRCGCNAGVVSALGTSDSMLLGAACRTLLRFVDDVPGVIAVSIEDMPHGDAKHEIRMPQTGTYPGKLVAAIEEHMDRG